MKNWIILIDVTILLLIASISFAQSQGPIPGPLKSSQEQQSHVSPKHTLTKNQQDTPTNFSPTIPQASTIHTNSKETNQTNNSNQKSPHEWSFFDLLLVIFNGLLAVFTFLLWWSTHRLWKSAEKQREDLRDSINVAIRSAEASEKAAEAALKSAEVLPKIERPYIFVTIELEEDGPIVIEANLAISVLVRIENYGKMPAILVSVHALVNPGETIPPNELKEIVKAVGETTIPEGIVIGAGWWYNHRVSAPTNHQEWNDIKNGRFVWLTCSGVIRYKEPISDTIRETGFLWHFHHFERKFGISNNNKLNYCT